MISNLRAKGTFFKNLKGGDLFAHDVDGAIALAICIQGNQSQFEAVALTHPPDGEQAPSLIKGHFQLDDSVLLFEDVTFLGVPDLAAMGVRKIPLGSIGFTTERKFLRCERGSVSWDVDIETGDLNQSSAHLPSFWLSRWKIVDADKQVIHANLGSP